MIDVVEGQLETIPDDRVIGILGGLVATRIDEFLKSRLIGVSYIVDDLAASAAIDTPAMPEFAVSSTIYALVEIARAHRGDMEVVRALARRERDTVNALRVL